MALKTQDEHSCYKLHFRANKKIIPQLIKLHMKENPLLNQNQILKMLQQKESKPYKAHKPVSFKRKIGKLKILAQIFKFTNFLSNF